MSPSAHLAVCVFPLQSYEYVSFADTLEKRLMSQQESQCLLHATKKDMRETLSWWLFYILERATKEWTNQPFAPQKYSLWLSCCVCWLWYFRSTWLLYNAHTNIHTCTQARSRSDGMLLLREARPSYLRIVQGHLTAQRWWLPWAWPLTLRPLMNTPDSHTAT